MITKVYSIGKTTNGKDINMLEISTDRLEAAADTEKESTVKAHHFSGNGQEIMAESKADKETKPSILVTAATHAREMISTTTNLYQALKLIKEGYIEKKPEMAKLLSQNKYYFLPVLNVDGVQFIEEFWKKNGKIIRKRKNENHQHEGGVCKGEFNQGEDVGVDINRNFGVDFGEVEDIELYKYNKRENP